MNVPEAFGKVERPARAVALTSAAAWGISSLFSLPPLLGEIFSNIFKRSGLLRGTSWVGKKATEE